MLCHVDLIDCHKLQWDIVKDVWDLLLIKEEPVFGKFTILFPGNKIPDWFVLYKEASNHNSWEVDINELVNLDGEIEGIAFSAFFGVEYAQQEVDFHCSINLFWGGSKIHRFSEYFSLSKGHILLCYCTLDSPKPKGGLRVEFHCKSDAVFSVNWGVFLVPRHEEKATDGMLNPRNPCSLPDTVDAHLDVADENTENSTDLMNVVLLAKRCRHDDDSGGGSELGSN